MSARYHLTARPWRPLEIPRAAYLEEVEDICRRETRVPAPCFAFAVAVLASEGRATDLIERGMSALDEGVARLAAPAIAALTGAYALFARHAAPERRARWQQWLRTPLARILEGEPSHTGDWRTWAMKGEWLRARAGLADAAMARAFVERNWIESGRERLADGAGWVHLLAMIAEGYDGKSAPEIRACAERAAALSLLAQDNEAPGQLAFELMAVRARDPWTAGQYRRAAMLAFHSAAPRRRVDALAPLAEAALVRRKEIAERPAPCETGGYAFAVDARFIANAGGMQVAANLEGGTEASVPGVARFARAGWDSRLGHCGGPLDRASGRGVSFAPTWMEGGRWVRLAEAATRYRGAFQVLFAHPLLVRCAIDYAPVAGAAGPVFRHELVITPDGVLASLQTPAPVQYAVTWPLVENDGEPLETAVTAHTAVARHGGSGDEQCFIALASRPGLSAEEERVRSAGGWLRPVRSRSNVTFVYPRSAEDPPAEAVRASFRPAPQGFASVLGRVAGNLYVGRTAAGGEGKSLDIDGDGRPEITFSAVCGFVAQLEKGRVTAIEADREVRAVVDGRRIMLAPFVPVAL